MDEKFAINLLRMIAAQMALQNALSVSREMFGRGYYALGVGEKQAVEQAVFGALAANYQQITAAFLEGQQAQQPMGFHTQAQQPIPGTSNP